LIIQRFGRYLHTDLKFKQFLNWADTKYSMSLLSAKHLISGISHSYNCGKRNQFTPVMLI
jgi:hypothetical protein